jgi:5-methyltetrahydrofolate--homocysteine methyltransferase
MEDIMFNLKAPLLLDGATGTNLIKAGMPSGVCVEQWLLDNPQTIVALQKAYVDAGSNVVTAPTFEANRYKLSQHGLGDKVADFNKRLVALSREAVGDRAAVAGNIAPTGIFVEPFGDETFDGLCEIFREQAFALRDAGVDYIACETFMSLTEARAALLAAKETGLPVTVTMTVDENGKTLSGGDVLACFVTLAAMGAAAVGLNCSTGPEIVLNAISGIAQHVAVPLIAKPNAGLPEKTGGFSISPEDFAQFAPKFYEQGVGILGGCCGTEPSYIASLHQSMDRASFKPLCDKDGALCEGVRDFIAACEKQPFFISEENLDFSHKIHCDSDLADNLLDLEGENCAARIVIANADDAHEFGMNAYLANVPVILLGYDLEALGEALKLYQGRAMLDSKSDVPHDGLEELSHRYGAIII